ncbi:GtrA family protein [Pelagicoccus sp. SDUM812003]|uniref:GtrA family protein n=1 Tax=Pelagicoccus sp. SDUM812003 TaxID=3041267 RepID=UPI00280D5744|nr:GtrA family protein [Pelagicoccus sp. SDUM812003]MDQ8201919.1 GtrA family protein [Pelagicoccus sp. SDUM812003]
MEELQRTLRQVTRFALVSGISLGIDYGIYQLLTEIAGLDSSWAKRLSFACIFIWAYFAHKHFTFRNRGFNPAEPIRFSLLYFSGWAINSVVHDLTAADANGSNPAFIAATFVWAVWNFIGQKLFVFRDRERSRYTD